jgi:hypothetical protein
MLSFSAKPWLFHTLAGALILIFGIQIYTESRLKSPTSDEPPHIASGLSYVETGVFVGNPQHPPLLKELSGLSLVLGGVRWPRDQVTEPFIRGEIPRGAEPEWKIGGHIIASGGPDRVLFWARLPFLLIACGLGFLIYWWGRQLFGGLAACCALFLFSLDPTILGHSFLVTMDVGLAAFSILFLFAVWNYIRRPGALRFVLCGLALGAVLCTKFSALFLIPVAAVLFLAAVVWPAESPEGGHRSVWDPFHAAKARKAEPRAAKRTSGARTSQPSRNASGANPWTLQRRLLLAAGALLGMCVVAVVVIQAVYFFPKDSLAYYHGLQLVNADRDPNGEAFLAGDFQPRFPSYFAVAYLLKEPIALIVLAAVGLVLLIGSKRISPVSKLFLTLPPLAMFAAHTLWADNLGVRYIMTVFPFAHLLGGLGLATLLTARKKWVPGVALALSGWAVLADAGVYPDHLSYFNEAACLLQDPSHIGIDGGARCGPAWLADSNVDWGQGLKQLKTWLDRNAKGRTVKLMDTFLFGFPPEAYGIAAVPMRDEELARRPPPGLYAISAHMIACLPPGSTLDNWLQTTPPTAIVGHAFYIYDIPGENGAPK